MCKIFQGYSPSIRQNSKIFKREKAIRKPKQILESRHFCKCGKSFARVSRRQKNLDSMLDTSLYSV